MSFVIGHGRRARATYPTSPGAAGSAASGVPLSRQRFIDGGTSNPGPGAASAPFRTIAAFVASRVNTSVQDATSNYVGWLTPALAGYTEDVAFPPHAATELRADSFSGTTGSGAMVIGNVTWANIGVAFSGTAPYVCMHNISVNGSFTVTDDVSSPVSGILFSADESYISGAGITGAFDSHTTVKLNSVSFENVVVNGINAGFDATDRAQVNLNNSDCAGNISARALTAHNSSISSTTIKLFSDGAFYGCEFATPAVLTSPSGSVFDGFSWRSFVEAGGTRDTGTFVLVVGGYNGAAVEGAVLTDADLDLSLNGTGATAGFDGENSGNHYTSSVTLGGDRAVTLKTGGGELKGDTILISRTSIADAHTLAVKNNAGTVIGTIPNSSRGFVLAQFNGSDWVFAEGGSLAA